MKRRQFLTGTGRATAALFGVAVGSAARGSIATENGTDVDEASATERGVASPRLPLCPSGSVFDPTYIDARLDSRSLSFENPTGARGGGGKTWSGRKGRPFHIFEPKEKRVLAELTGPGTLRHIWMALIGLPPEVARAMRLEVFYDGLSEPSISVPAFDFFGLPHGRYAEYYSSMTAIHEGRGLNSYVPIPFGRSIRVEFTNESTRHVGLFYQIDYTLQPSIPESYLHVTFRRENPTTLRQDFVIVEGLKGPGRFLGCCVGIRILDKDPWYGEGEVKVYRDGDVDFPTICGTGLEDYVGSALGLGRHYAQYSGAPIVVPEPSSNSDMRSAQNPNLVGFYRWHLPDPVMFSNDLRITIQQIGGAALFRKGQEAEFEAYKNRHPAAGPGWILDSDVAGKDSLGFALLERQDDYCAAAFVYCRRAQPVLRFDTDTAVRDIGTVPAEVPAEKSHLRDEEERGVLKLRKYWEISDR